MNVYITLIYLTTLLASGNCMYMCFCEQLFIYLLPYIHILYICTCVNAYAYAFVCKNKKKYFNEILLWWCKNKSLLKLKT